MLKTSNVVVAGMMLVFSLYALAHDLSLDISKTICSSAAQTNYLEVYAEKAQSSGDLLKSNCRPVVFHRCAELQCDQNSSEDCGTKDSVSEGQFKLEGSMVCCSRSYRGQGEAYKTTGYFRNGRFEGHQTNLVFNSAADREIQRLCR